MKRYKALKNLGITLSLLMSSMPAPLYAQGDAEENEQEFKGFSLSSSLHSLWNYSRYFTFGRDDDDGTSLNDTNDELEVTPPYARSRRERRNESSDYDLSFLSSVDDIIDSNNSVPIEGTSYYFDRGIEMCLDRDTLSATDFGGLEDIMDFFTNQQCGAVILEELNSHAVNSRLSKAVVFCNHVKNIYNSDSGRGCFPESISMADFESYQSRVSSDELEEHLIEKNREQIHKDVDKLKKLVELQMKFATDLDTLEIMRSAAQNNDGERYNLDGIDNIATANAEQIAGAAFKCTAHALFPVEGTAAASHQSVFDKNLEGACAGKEGNDFVTKARARAACEGVASSSIVGQDTQGQSCSPDGHTVFSNSDLGEATGAGTLTAQLLGEEADRHNEYLTMMVGLYDYYGTQVGPEGNRSPAGNPDNQNGILSIQADHLAANTFVMDPNGSMGRTSQGLFHIQNDSASVEQALTVMDRYINDSDSNINRNSAVTAEQRRDLLGLIQGEFISEEFGRKSLNFPPNSSLSQMQDQLVDIYMSQNPSANPSHLGEAAGELLLMVTAGCDTASSYNRAYHDRRTSMNKMRVAAESGSFENNDGTLDEKKVAESYYQSIKDSDQFNAVAEYMKSVYGETDYGESFKEELIESIKKSIKEDPTLATKLLSGDHDPRFLSYIGKKILLDQVQGECKDTLDIDSIDKRYCPSTSDPETSNLMLADIFGESAGDIGPAQKEDDLKSAVIACVPILVSDQMNIAMVQGERNGLDPNTIAANVMAQGQAACRNISEFELFKDVSSNAGFMTSLFGGDSCASSNLISNFMKENNLVTQQQRQERVTSVSSNEMNEKQETRRPPSSMPRSISSFSGKSMSRDGRDHSVDLGITGMEVQEFNTTAEGTTAAASTSSLVDNVISSSSDAITSIFGTDKASNPTAGNVVARSSSLQNAGTEEGSVSQQLEDELKGSGEVDSKTAGLLNQLKAMEERQAQLQSQLNQVMNDKANSTSSEADPEKERLIAELEALKKKIPELEDKIRNASNSDEAPSRVASSASSARRSSSPSASPTPSSRSTASAATSSVGPASVGGASSGGGSSISPSSNPDGYYAGSGVISTDGSSAPNFTQNTVFTLTKSIRDRAAIVSSGVSIDEAILENNGAILIPNGNGEYMYVEPEFTADGEVKTLDGRVVYKEVLRVTDPEAIAQASSDDSSRMPASVDDVDSSRRTYRLQELESALEDAQDSAGVQ